LRIDLVCWHCGKATAAEVQREPQFAFEVVGWANDVGMLGVLDTPNRRALVFCDEAHADAERTKAGGFRLRRRGFGSEVAAEQRGP
jgi:hypothetical protein